MPAPPITLQKIAFFGFLRCIDKALPPSNGKNGRRLKNPSARFAADAVRNSVISVRFARK